MAPPLIIRPLYTGEFDDEGEQLYSVGPIGSMAASSASTQDRRPEPSPASSNEMPEEAALNSADGDTCTCSKDAIRQQDMGVADEKIAKLHRRATMRSCSCQFHISFEIPCRHIIAVRDCHAKMLSFTGGPGGQAATSLSSFQAQSNESTSTAPSTASPPSQPDLPAMTCPPRWRRGRASDAGGNDFDASQVDASGGFDYVDFDVHQPQPHDPIVATRGVQHPAVAEMLDERRKQVSGFFTNCAKAVEHSRVLSEKAVDAVFSAFAGLTIKLPSGPSAFIAPPPLSSDKSKTNVRAKSFIETLEGGSNAHKSSSGTNLKRPAAGSAPAVAPAAAPSGGDGETTPRASTSEPEPAPAAATQSQSPNKGLRKKAKQNQAATVTMDILRVSHDSLSGDTPIYCPLPVETATSPDYALHQNGLLWPIRRLACAFSNNQLCPVSASKAPLVVNNSTTSTCKQERIQLLCSHTDAKVQFAPKKSAKVWDLLDKVLQHGKDSERHGLISFIIFVSTKFPKGSIWRVSEAGIHRAVISGKTPPRTKEISASPDAILFKDGVPHACIEIKSKCVVRGAFCPWTPTAVDPAWVSQLLVQMKCVGVPRGYIVAWSPSGCGFWYIDISNDTAATSGLPECVESLLNDDVADGESRQSMRDSHDDAWSAFVEHVCGQDWGGMSAEKVRAFTGDSPPNFKYPKYFARSTNAGKRGPFQAWCDSWVGHEISAVHDSHGEVKESERPALSLWAQQPHHQVHDSLF